MLQIFESAVRQDMDGVTGGGITDSDDGWPFQRSHPGEGTTTIKRIRRNTGDQLGIVHGNGNCIDTGSSNMTPGPP
jgi:hypothetical protein